MTIQWITSHIGTAAFSNNERDADYEYIDVRDLVDRSGNMLDVLENYIDSAILSLKSGKRVVINCDHGISRSNSLAVAILSRWEKISISHAIRRVLKATNNAEIRLEVLDAVRDVLSNEKPKKSGENWLITGGHGYLGSLLVNNTPKRIKLYAPSHDDLDLMGAVNVDLYVRKYGINRIIHFAAPRIGNINSSMGNSIAMLKNIMDVSVSNRIPLLVPSRWEVFGGYKSQSLYADENLALKPQGVLGYTKSLIETIAQQYVENLGLELTIARFGLVYGLGGAPNFVNNFIHKAKDGDKITTHQYNNGLPMIDLIHASDWIEGCWKVLLSGLTGTFHLASGNLTSTFDIAKIINMALGNKSELEHIRIDDNVSNIILGSTRIKNELSWWPMSNHEQMIGDFAIKSLNSSS